MKAFAIVLAFAVTSGYAGDVTGMVEDCGKLIRFREFETKHSTRPLDYGIACSPLKHENKKGSADSKQNISHDM